MNIFAKIAACEANESTAYPVWGIVRKAGFGHHAWLAGPYFSRASATEYLESHRYRYGEKAFVFCFSGHDSPGYREVYDASKAMRGAE